MISPARFTRTECIISSTHIKRSSLIVEKNPSPTICKSYLRTRACSRKTKVRYQRESDKIVQALAIYTSEDKRSFGFLHYWNTLKHQQKWIDRPGIIIKKNEKIAPTPSLGTVTPETDSSQCQDAAGGSTPDEESMRFARPLGRKGEK